MGAGRSGFFLNGNSAHDRGNKKHDRGHTIGRHVGLSFYTLGQRQGLGIGGIREKGAQRGGGDHAPWFVARKDVKTNTLWVVQGHDHPWLLSNGLVSQDMSWTAGRPPELAASQAFTASAMAAAYSPARRLSAKTRYRQNDAACWLTAAPRQSSLTELGDPGAVALAFDEPQWAVTPGQSAVLYDGDVCLGGGVIASAT